ncbi:hypothetical protein ACFO0S_11050 [Chryseomicrobium palamuruense]|uniref:Uncharacterized protein n=1 Tax=Chryseomicrobium palamuruense TaxID=682973 RepID=A0ABV8UX81_9BACL
MPKIPLTILKELGTKGIDYAKKNPETVKTALAAAPLMLKGLKELNDKKHEWHLNKMKKKTELGKVEYRDIRYMRYQDHILPNLDAYTYMKLDECISEVESFIIRLSDEMTVIKRPKLMPRIAKWQKVKAQLESHRDVRFYTELMRINEDATYESDFLSKNVQEHFRELPTLDGRKEFVLQFTNKDEEKVAMDFLKYN